MQIESLPSLHFLIYATKINYQFIRVDGSDKYMIIILHTYGLTAFHNN